MTAMITPRSKLRAHGRAYLVLAVLFLIAFTNWARESIAYFEELRHGVQVLRDPFTLVDRAAAASVEPEAEAAGVRQGDVLLSVEGRPIEGFGDYYAALRRARRGDRLNLQVRSDSAAAPLVKNVSIALETVGSRVDIFIIVLIAVMQVLCLALGFWVAAVCIGDRAAWLLLVVMLSFANSIGVNFRTIYGSSDILQPLFTMYRLSVGSLAPTALAFFAMAFPDRLPFDRRHPWVKWVVFGPLVAQIAAAALLATLQTHHLSLVLRLRRLYAPLEPLRFLQVAGALGFVAILGYKTVTTSDRDARRRLLLLVGGAVLSIVPSTILVLVTLRSGGDIVGWTALVVVLMFLIFPLTMAYVIVVHRAMDVRVAVRLGLQYLLARGGIRVVQLAMVIAVSVVAASLLSGGAGAPRVAAVVAGMAAAVALGRRFVDRLRRWVDRRFFREAYEADAILSDLASRVRTMVETGPLLETVATRIAESLHVPRIAILLDGGGVFRPAYALGYVASPAAAIPEESLTVKRLRKQHAFVQFDDEDSWVQLTEGAERESLKALNPELLLPLSLNDKLIGIMSLGTKQSEEPFSRTDIRLLDSVAAQTGLALENGRLTAAIAAEVAARAKQTRDLEIAREVQERLFPQEYPPIAGLDYAGACRPALGIGGDYYDFILLANAQLGIAIGDVSGKGIPAALLMASLRAYLRGAQTIHHQTDLTKVMATLNNLVYDSSTANRYATFFYGEYDAASRVLTYVNGGHNAPMLFRQSGAGKEVARLDTGGPVIGLMEDCVYSQGTVTLEPGDVLVAYTDGISEAMNAADEEFGEDRLQDAVRPNRTAPARDVIDRLMRAADTFVAGAPQHDDMTVIVVRVV